MTISCSIPDDEEIIGTWKLVGENVNSECGYTYFNFEKDKTLIISSVGETTQGGQLKCLKTTSTGTYRLTKEKLLAENMVATGDHEGRANKPVEFGYRFDKGDLHLTAMDNTKLHLMKITKY